MRKHKRRICISYEYLSSESNYRTLKIGEYVEFELDDNCEGQHNEQAVKVTGIKVKTSM